MARTIFAKPWLGALNPVVQAAAALALPSSGHHQGALCDMPSTANVGMSLVPVADHRSKEKIKTTLDMIISLGNLERKEHLETNRQNQAMVHQELASADASSLSSLLPSLMQSDSELGPRSPISKQIVANDGLMLPCVQTSADGSSVPISPLVPGNRALCSLESSYVSMAHATKDRVVLCTLLESKWARTIALIRVPQAQHPLQDK